MFSSVKYVVLLSVASLLTSCGGSNDSGNGGSEQSGPTSAWELGVFPDWSSFADLCEVPRTGTDLNGNSFDDVQGTAFDEKMWMRSWSNDLYFWYDEIEDQDPDLFEILDYFDELKTQETTPTGRPKDNFHFTQDTASYLARSQSGVTSGYGMQLVIGGTTERVVTISDVEPGSPAELAGITRGTRIAAVDGAQITSNDSGEIDILNAGLFPSDEGETHEFVVFDLNSSTERTVDITSANVEIASVKYTRVIQAGGNSIGYLNFASHIAPAEAALFDAFSFLNSVGVDELVLDMRYNGGGFLTIASQLAYMVAGPTLTGGRTFDLIQFNDKYPTTNPVTGASISPDPFQSTTVGFSLTPGQSLPSLGLDRVFVLAGPNTCSASESVINGLRGIGVEVVLIGKTTCGKPYGFYAFDNCGTTYFSVQFQSVNDQNFGEYPDGFSPANEVGAAGVSVPGCDVDDDLDHLLGDPEEARLAAALYYVENGTCPTTTSTSASAEKLSQNRDDPLLYGVHPSEQIRIYGGPGS